MGILSVRARQEWTVSLAGAAELHLRSGIGKDGDQRGGLLCGPGGQTNTFQGRKICIGITFNVYFFTSLTKI